MSQSIAAIIIARNEEDMLEGCLNTLRWCDEVVVINNDSSDATVSIAHKWGARVFSMQGGFAKLRTAGVQLVKTDWLLYVDADERVTPALAHEVQQVVAAPHTTDVAFKVRRVNVMYGQAVWHGGWERDEVVRLFRRPGLQHWAGEVHEHAVVTGTTGALKQTLVHFTHRDVISGLKKTTEWTPMEAQQLVAAQIAPVTGWTLLRKGGMEFFRRFIQHKGYQDGMVGWIEALVQAMNRVLVYIQAWELQQQPSLPEQYQAHEEEIAALWKRHHQAKSRPTLES